MRTKLLTVVILLPAISACSLYRPGAGLDVVEAESKARLRPELISEFRIADESELEARLQSLLADDLTSDKAVQIALLNNLELKAQYEQLGLSQAELLNASLAANPVITVERRFSGKALEFDVAQNFLSFVLLPLRKQMAEAEFDAAKLELTQRVVEHALETRGSFYKVQALSQIADLRRSAALAAEAAVDIAIRLREAGNITALELHERQAEMAEARLELAQTDSELMQERENLNVLMGLWGKPTGWKIQPALPELPATETIEKNLESIAIGTRADLLAINKQLRSRGQALGIAKIESFLPELTLGSHFEREPEGNETAGPSIDIALPIFDFGQTRRGAATALLNQARMLYAALAIKIRAEVRSAHARMQIARARVEHYQSRLLPTQQRRLEQTQRQYNAMQLGPFELIHSRQEQLEALEAQTEALKEYWLARTDLEKALGKELPLESQTPHQHQPSSHEHHPHH